MYLEKEDPYLWVKKLFAVVIIAVFSFGLLGTAVVKIKEIRADSSLTQDGQVSLIAVGQNSLMAVSNPADPIRNCGWSKFFNGSF